jgi:hypothetical protein
MILQFEFQSSDLTDNAVTFKLEDPLGFSHLTLNEARVISPTYASAGASNALVLNCSWLDSSNVALLRPKSFEDGSGRINEANAGYIDIGITADAGLRTPLNVKVIDKNTFWESQKTITFEVWVREVTTEDEEITGYGDLSLTELPQDARFVVVFEAGDAYRAPASHQYV